MKQGQSTSPSLETTFLLTAGVLLVVIMALVLAQADSYQRQSTIPSNNLPVIDPEATVAAGEMVVVYLPSEVSPTPILAGAPKQAPSEDDETVQDATIETFESTCSEAADDWSPYIVRAGDSLDSLALQFDLSVDAIMQANCLPHESIIAGQQIVLPYELNGSPAAPECKPPPDWVQVIVGSPDTLSKLARAHGTTVYHLMEANCLQNADLIVGQTIFLPLVPPADVYPSGSGPMPTAGKDAINQQDITIFPLATPAGPFSP